MPQSNPPPEAFYSLLSKLNTKEDHELFGWVFFTENEREMFAERMAIFRELAAGRTQREVARNLNCSVVTVTRGAKNYNANKEAIYRILAQVEEPLESP